MPGATFAYVIYEKQAVATSWEDFRSVKKPYSAWLFYKPRMSSLFTGFRFLLSSGSSTAAGGFPGLNWSMPG